MDRLSRRIRRRRVRCALSWSDSAPPRKEPRHARPKDPVLLAAAVRAALSGGASTINVTDAGFILFDELAACITRLRGDVPELAGAIPSFHGHDDLGVATANAIAAVASGARQIEVAGPSSSTLDARRG